MASFWRQAASFGEDLVVFETDAMIEATSQKREVGHPDDETGAAWKWDALVLGTRDYVSKCGFSKALIGFERRDRLGVGGGDRGGGAGCGERDGRWDAERVLV